jgi:hypothetical protein
MISPVVELKVNEFVLQIGSVTLLAIVGFGFMVTVAINAAPSHDPEVGVME